ncbi:MAG TPA: lipopolysaccharide kinase InaA family protein [Verrucomicrobiae bacterium]
MREPCFESLRAGGFVWRIALPLDDAARAVLEDPAKIFRDLALSLHSGRSTVVGVGATFAVKRYNPRVEFRRFNTYRRAFCAPRLAFHALEMSARLRAAGFPAARIFAAAQRRESWRGWLGYCVAERIPDLVALNDWHGERRKVLLTLAVFLAMLHRDGFSHRDLSGTNVLLDPHGNPVLVDLDDVEFFGEVSMQRAALDLKWFSNQLALQPPLRPREAARFLIQYAQRRGEGSSRTWLLKILDQTRRR